MQHLVRRDRASGPAARRSRTRGPAGLRRAAARSTSTPRPRRSPTAAASLGGGFTDRVELANAAYGQAEILVTPLQMALVAATVANDGTLMRPHLVLEATGKGGHDDDRPIGAAARSSRRASRGRSRAAMRLAVSGQVGQVFTAGANVPRPDRRRQVRHGRAGRRARAAFLVHRLRAGDDPQVAIAVLVERSGGGRSRRRRSPASSSGRGSAGPAADVDRPRRDESSRGR